jgi:pimeloyl-ACP methyl ester carboxylesterase
MGPERFIDVEGIRTRYFEAGSGAPIALFHGGNFGFPGAAASSAAWEPLFTRLASKFRVIAVDRLGQGRTGLPKRDDDYTMTASSRHSAAFLRSHGGGPYHVVGHSRGGYIVARIAIECPDLVKTCTIVSSGSLSPGSVRNHIVHAHPPPPVGSHANIRWEHERYSFNPSVVTDEWVRESEELARTEDIKTSIRKMVDEKLETRVFVPDLMRERAATHRFLLEHGLSCPTLVAWGLNDPTADPENGKLLIEMLMHKQPRTEVRYFNRAGHYVFREQPAAFAAMLQRFVDAHS